MHPVRDPHRFVRVFLLSLLLAAFVPLVGVGSHAQAATGTASLTLIKEATPATAFDFTITHEPDPLGFFGDSSGTDGGDFYQLQGIAIAPDGSFYVADSGNDRIQKFDAAGNFLFTWGWGVQDGTPTFQICSTNCTFGRDGSGDGQFDEPRGVAIGADGSVYVADTDNDRIQQFDAAGNFVRKWGSNGGSISEFRSPSGIAIGPDGSVYISDTNNYRIQQYTATGNFVRMWGKDVALGGDTDFEICTSNCQSGISNSGVGELSYPFGVTVGADGSVYVVDSSNQRIQQFEAEGNFVRMWGRGVNGGSGFEICTSSCVSGDFGSGPGQFSYPEDVAVGADGTIFVADSGNGRVQQFDAAGNFVQAWGQNVDPSGGTDFEICIFSCQVGGASTDLGALNGPRGLAAAHDGTIFVTEYYNNRVQRFLGAAIVLDDPVTDDGDVYTNTMKIEGLPARSYTFTEEPSSLWALGDVTCNVDVGLAHAPDSDSFSLTLDASEQAICTLHNREQVSLTLVKDATPADGTDFLLSPTLTPLRAFGEVGTNPGQFGTLRGGAVGPDGSVYTVEGNRVQRFDAAGTFIQQWGATGGDAGQFSISADVAVGVDGTVYVADSNNHRIQKFTAEGNFVRMWGKDVANSGGTGFEVCTSNCKSGTTGSGNGELDTPYSVAVGPDGLVYVADLGNDRVQVFDADGNFVRIVGGFGTSDGGFIDPVSLAVAPNGLIYVVDQTMHRVQQFDAQGNHLRIWGRGVKSGANAAEICVINCQGATAGSGVGEFNLPNSVAVGPDGAVYVADQFNRRVQQFDAAGNFVRMWGKDVDASGGSGFEVCTTGCKAGVSGSGLGEFNLLNEVMVGGDGSIYVLDSSNSLAHRFFGAAIVLDDAATDDNDGIDDTVQIKGLTADEYVLTEMLPELWAMSNVNCSASSTIFADHFLVTLTADAEVTCSIQNKGPAIVRVVKDASPADGTDFAIAPSLRHLNTFGSFGSDLGQLNYPDGIALGPDGSIYVADYDNHRIQKFDAFGNVVGVFGTLGTDEGEFVHPVDVAVAADNSIYVVDYENHRVQQFDAMGIFVRMWGRGVDTGANTVEICTADCQAGSVGSGAGQFNLPLGIAVGVDGTVYVVDSNNYRVQRFNSTGTHLGSFGSSGSGNGQFSFAFDVATGADGAVFVADAAGGRVQEFNATGTFVRVIGSQGSSAGQLNYPTRVAVAADGSLLVTEVDNDRVSQFDADGTFVRAFGWDVVPDGGTEFEVCTTSCKAGVAGNGVGQFNELYGIAVAQNGIFYVVDAANYRVQRFLGAPLVVDDSDPSDADDFGNVQAIRGLPVGSYDLTEVLPTTWQLEGVNCTGATGSPSGNGVTVPLTNGTDATCTFTNGKIPQTLTVHVAIVGGGPLGAADFPVFIDGVSVARSTAKQLSTGEHTVTQTGNPQYTTSFSGACNSAGKVTLGVGDNLVCTVVNTYITQALTVEVVVVGGGPLGANGFPLFVDGNSVARGTATNFAAGLHVVSQTSDPRYSVSFGGACDASGNVNLGIGANVTCTITNTLLPVGTLGGKVWQDSNGNGLQDDGEPGIAGVTVILDNAPDVPADVRSALETVTTTTDGNGNYAFTDLAPGDYQVRIVPPAGMEFTATQAGTSSLDSDAQQAKLNLQVTGPSEVHPGDAVSYQLAYTNTGTLPATGVVISTTIPANSSFDPEQNDGWACTAGVCTLGVNDVAAGASATASLQLGLSADVSTPTTVTLTVDIHHATQGSTATISLPPAGSNITVGAGLVPLDVSRITAAAQTVITPTEVTQEFGVLFLPAITVGE